jgi:DNA adenine methylase
MRYPGGKGKTYQHIISLMPPHRVYIETHIGGGAVMRHKRPALRNIGVDADTRVIEERLRDVSPDVELFCERAEDFLLRYGFQGDELVYVDPPYLPSTRSQQNLYRHEYTTADHERLLSLLVTLPCMVIVSGYASSMYNQALPGWGTRTFRSKTHTDVKVETLWFNFEPPDVLHDARYLGGDFRQRQTTQRRMLRLQERVRRMPPAERAAFSEWLYETYPSPSTSPST